MNRFKLHPCLHPSWTCSHEPPQLVFRPSPINRLIFTQTHHTVNGRNHFALSSRTMYACQLFDSCRLPKKHEPASGVAAGVSAAYRFCTSKIKIKSDLYPSRNILWPYTLQPPRRQEFQPASQLSPIVTNTVPWIICESFVPFTAKYTLKALICLCTGITRRTWRTKHDNFHYCFSLWSCLKKKFPNSPCTCCVANASSFDINTGVKVQIPLAINSIGNLATEVAFFGYVRLLDSLFVSSCGYPPHTTSYKTSMNRFKLHPCLHPSWTCSHEPPQLVFRPSPINRLIFTQTHHTVNKKNHFALSSRTMYACQLFDSCRLPKKHEPASGVAAGVSAAYRFCTSKITIKSDLYPSRNIFWPYTLQPPRRQEFQPASQLSPIVTNTVPWIASLLYAQPNTPWEHVDLSLH